jgi:peptidoglycan/xylan/chitin deacetylase (PgdA/CDA1 family)
MILLHNVGPKLNANYTTAEEILRCKEQISFDGVYYNVWVHRHILKPKLVGAILFVMGDFVGKDNSFDKGQYLEAYCGWNEIMDLVTNFGCVLGYHSKTHRNLLDLSDEEVLAEVMPPFPSNVFAYPYGSVDERVARIVKECGYQAAWSVHQGDGSQFQKKRRYL